MYLQVEPYIINIIGQKNLGIRPLVCLPEEVNGQKGENDIWNIES